MQSLKKSVQPLSRVFGNQKRNMALVWDVKYWAGPKDYPDNKAVHRAMVYVDDTPIKDMGFSMNRKGKVNLQCKHEPFLIERLKSQFLGKDMMVRGFIKVKSYDFAGK